MKRNSNETTIERTKRLIETYTQIYCEEAKNIAITLNEEGVFTEIKWLSDTFPFFVFVVYFKSKEDYKKGKKLMRKEKKKSKYIQKIIKLPVKRGLMIKF